MQYDGLIGELDIAILCVAAFFLFFIGLVIYLRREDKREGYPLESSTAAGGVRYLEGFPSIPRPKFFYLPNDRGTVQAPLPRRAVGGARAAPPLDGFPLAAGPNPLADGIGAASWRKERNDAPDLTVAGDPKIVPLSKWPKYHVAHGDPDPRGFEVIAAGGEPVGRIVDLWFNRAEFFLRYFEVELDGEARTRMAPAFFCEVVPRARQVHAYTLSAEDFRRVPVTGSADVITVREEDRLNGYFGGGIIYSNRAPERLAS